MVFSQAIKKHLYQKVVLLASLCCFAPSVWADYALNLVQGVTPISRQVYDLHMLVLWICVAIGVGVFGVMIWSIIYHRKSVNKTPATFSHNTVAEIVWTVIPIIIIISLVFPAAKLLVAMEDNGDADVTIKVTGYQWKWKYDYLDEDLSFFSVLAESSNEVRQLKSGLDPAQVDNYLLEVDEPLVLPVNTKVRVLLTAADVLHAWWVPDLGWKKDAVPGFVNNSWTYIEKEGTYRGQCAELCGRDHGFMPIVLKAVSKEDYRAWVAETKLRLANTVVDGEKIYKTNCAVCHQAGGQGVPGAFPSLVASPVIVDGSPDDHINLVLHGKALMPGFAGQLSDAEIAAVVNYERTSWGNQASEVTEDDVQRLRSVIASK